jgi:hypothetical protein
MLDISEKPAAIKPDSTASKRQKFVELAENRTVNAIKAIRIIAKLGNKHAYKYDDSDVGKIVRALNREIDALKARMTSAGGKESVDFKLDWMLRGDEEMTNGQIKELVLLKSRQAFKLSLARSPLKLTGSGYKHRWTMNDDEDVHLDPDYLRQLRENTWSQNLKERLAKIEIPDEAPTLVHGIDDTSGSCRAS